VIKLKKKKTRLPTFTKTKKNLGPSFQGWEKIDGRAFHNLKWKASSFYYSNLDSKDLLEEAWSWMASHGYEAKDIKAAMAASGTHAVSGIVGVKCLLMNIGCPDINEKEVIYCESLPSAGKIVSMTNFIHNKLKQAIIIGQKNLELEKTEKEVLSSAPKYSIQDRIFQVAQGVSTQLEDWLEVFHRDPSDFNPESLNIIDLFDKNEINQAHARKIISFYEKQKEEFWTIVNMPKLKEIEKFDAPLRDELLQIIEGYRHLTKDQAAKFLKALENIIDACNLIIGKGKATRKTRVKKAPSKEKLVLKLKYKASDNETKLASINPVEIPESTIIWVYNTKYKKLGCYVADDTAQVLSVKGSKIVGYSESKSFQKTLRKPIEQLKDFMSETKIGMQRSFNGIKTKVSPMNGRINTDTLILRSYK
jgi:hypothetical protein